MGRVNRRPRAIIDLADAAGYLAEDSIDAALRFLENAERAFEQLAEHPALGRLRQPTRLFARPLRSWPVPGFPNWLVFYLPLLDGVDVIRVLHGARDLPEILEDDGVD